MTAFRQSTTPGAPALTPATTAYKIAPPPPSAEHSVDDDSTAAPEAVDAAERAAGAADEPPVSDERVTPNFGSNGS